MKKMLLVALYVVAGNSLFAQTWDEWWAQKKTQIKYLGQQIASLQIYIGYVEKGYHIAQQGLTAICDIKNGEFNLHGAFFSSLASVNPAIAHDAKVAAIVALQVSIVQKYKAAYGQAKQGGYFNGNEVSYIYNVFTSLLDDCANDIANLITLTTSGQLQMTDDERIKRLDGLYADMQDKYAFTQSFGNSINVMGQQRRREQQEAATMQTLYNIH